MQGSLDNQVCFAIASSLFSNLPERTSLILVVEDEPLVRKFVCLILTRQGYQIEQASNGLAGLQRWETGAFDLVVSDLDMPEMGGLEMIQRILQAKPDQRFLVITGRADSVPTGWPHLAKPFLSKDLLQTVELLLPSDRG